MYGADMPLEEMDTIFGSENVGKEDQERQDAIYRRIGLLDDHTPEKNGSEHHEKVGGDHHEKESE